MLQDIGNKVYKSEYKPDRKVNDDDYVIIFRGPNLLMKEEGENTDIPSYNDVKQFTSNIDDYIYLFEISEKSFFLLMNENSENVTETDNLKFENLHAKVEFLIPDWRYFGCTTALHLSYWYEHSKFCGKCGHKLEHSKTERAMVCPECGTVKYHDMSVAIIVGVRNGNKLLLTRYAGSRSGYHALVAGFMDPGETLEDTVRREVMEETGVKVKNIKYVGSQPWGYSRNILVGFYADLDGDDTITRQESELAEAKWVDREDIPLRENLMSLTATLMQTFKQGKDEEAIKTSLYEAKPDYQV